MTNPAPWIESAKSKHVALSAEAAAAHAKYSSLADRFRRLSESRNLKAAHLAILIRNRDLSRDDTSAIVRNIADLEREISGLDLSIAAAERQMQAAEQQARPLFGLRAETAKILLNLNVITREEAGA